MTESTPTTPSPPSSPPQSSGYAKTTQETTTESTPATPIAPSTPPQSPGGTKTIFLIRHAESLENQRIASMFNCLGDLGRFSMPKRSDVGASFGLLKVSENHDAPISEVGLHQCEVMKEKLKESDFVAVQKIQMVVHSPLIRAKQTCKELLGCSSEQVVDESTEKVAEAKEEEEEEEVKFQPETPETTATATPATPSTPTTTPGPSYPAPIERVVNLNLLSEKTSVEWLPGKTSSFEQRVLGFQKWLAEQPESIIAVVGHSQYFKLLLGLPFKFDNVDVYQVQFDPNKSKPNEPVILEHDGTADEVALKPQWYDLKLLHACKEKAGQKQQLQTPTKTSLPKSDVGTPSTVASADGDNLL